jgi:hypothetical protein
MVTKQIKEKTCTNRCSFSLNGSSPFLAMEKISAQCYDYRLLDLLIKQQHHAGLNMEASPAPG